MDAAQGQEGAGRPAAGAIRTFCRIWLPLAYPVMHLHVEQLRGDQPGSPALWQSRTLESAYPTACAFTFVQAWVNTTREEWKVVNGRTEKLQAAEAVHEAAKKRAKDAVRLATFTRHCALALHSCAVYHRLKLMLLCAAAL